MTEYISKEVAKRIIDSERSKEQMLSMLDSKPAADLVEVIRCKNCAEWATEWQPLPADRGHYCGMIDSITKPEFYCSYGERRK